ncbi:MAG: hypothetical protein OXF26_07295, partial [Alphaproteobacteria bacterium]|nr:hypothetical protein [Alphaproteobacteria bacterium]
PAGAIAQLRAASPVTPPPPALPLLAGEETTAPAPPIEAAGETATPEEPSTVAPPPGAPAPDAPLELTDFNAVATLFEERREPRLHSHLIHDAHLVSFEPGRLVLKLGERAPHNLAAEIAKRLIRWTGQTWAVLAVDEDGDATLAEQYEDARRDLFERAQQHPLAQRTLEIFPDAAIADIRPIQPSEALVEPPEEQDDKR